MDYRGIAGKALDYPLFPYALRFEARTGKILRQQRPDCQTAEQEAEPDTGWTRLHMIVHELRHMIVREQRRGTVFLAKPFVFVLFVPLIIKKGETLRKLSASLDLARQEELFLGF